MELEKSIKQDNNGGSLKAEYPQEQVQQQVMSEQEILNNLADYINSTYNNCSIHQSSNYTTHHSIQIQTFKDQAPNLVQNQIVIDQPLYFYRELFPNKLMKYLMDYINGKMKASYTNVQEKQIKKKFIKLDEINDFYGLKIIMGYIKMPFAQSYFNTKQIFQCKIFESFKEGRFQCLEQWSNFTDESLLKSINKPKPLDEFQAKRICKKFGKALQSVKQAGKDLILQINVGFNVQNESQSQCQSIILSDPKSKLIVWSHFCFNNSKEETGVQLVDVLQAFQNRNHTIYVYDNLLSFQQMIFLKLKFKIQCVSIIEKPQDQNKLPIYLECLSIVNEKDDTYLITSGEDPQTLINNYKSYKEVMLYYCIHKYRPNFSYAHYSSAITTEFQEIVLWNTFQLQSKVFEKQQQQEPYEQFRLNLSQELLKNKIQQIKNVPSLLQKSKVCNLQISTDITGEYGLGTKIIQKSNFHIPTILATPKSYSGSMNCLVCKRNTQLITLCKPCSEITGKFVILCACDCFYLFHQNTIEYIINGEDLTQVQYKSIEQSSQQLFYQAFQQKPGLMYENNTDKGKQVQYSKQVEIE